uniref:S1-like domain-containing protein n=1 Tax=Florenciella sp. virus SA2 TaxID=3240092 RepID=A0AB39JEQ4_9VIRU
MVKNFGGKHGKKIARKNANTVQIEKKLRFASGPEELYGIVTKCQGNGIFLVICNDQKERLCIIRNKFTGRNKQSNLITIGSWIIIGLRTWETVKENKKEKCDLLEIYNNNEKHKLLQNCDINLSYLIQQENIILNINDDEIDKQTQHISFVNNNSDINYDDNANLVEDETENNIIEDDINFDEI